jgi:hypothetical protein
MEVIQRLVADGDYRLNDRPAGFMPPSLPPAGHRKLPVYYGCSRDPVGVMTVAEAARWGDRNIPKDLKR